MLPAVSSISIHACGVVPIVMALQNKIWIKMVLIKVVLIPAHVVSKDEDSTSLTICKTYFETILL